MEVPHPILTSEERDILILISLHPGAKHLTNGEIGQRLGIPVARVKTLLHQACIKLGADNRNEAVLRAIQRGEIHLDELFSLEELAEILSSLDPDVLRTIASCVRSGRVQKTFPVNTEIVFNTENRQPGLLTNRERDVLILARYGLTNSEIAGRLCMTTDAVRTFLNRAFKKLGARKKADAIQLALKTGELTLSEMTSQDELGYFLAPLGAESIEKLAYMLEEKRTKRPG